MNPIDIIPQINSLKKIIKKNIHLVSQNDMTVMKNFSSRFQHPWYNFYEELTDEEKERFDASRQFQLIEDEDWIKTVQSIKALSKFQKIETKKYDKQLLGKKKKQHEYGQLRALIEPLKCSAIADFGGGVGKLSFFLNDDLKIKSVVFDQDEKLLSIGKARAKKLHLNEVTFVKLQVDENLDCDQNLNKYDLGIGLHCCGNFGSDLLKLSVKNNMNSIMLFSCCYSKIINDDYRLSSQSLDIDLNLRALSSATLSFESIESGLYNFRLQILDFKYSFYHLLIQHHGISTFFPMSNSRKSMFNKSFYEFYQESMRKYLSLIHI